MVCGGGHNHRFSLSDAVMAKDNHLAVLTAGPIPANPPAVLAAERGLEGVGGTALLALQGICRHCW